MNTVKPGHTSGAVGPEYNTVPERALLRFHMLKTTFPRCRAEAHSISYPEGLKENSHRGYFTFYNDREEL